MNAYILCGGESRRMGQPKAMLPFRNHTFADYIASISKKAGFTPHCIVKQGQSFPLSSPLLFEAKKQHPLSGIIRAMEHSPTEFFLILPCDTPYLRPSSIQKLQDVALRRQQACVAFDMLSTPKAHPLIGMYAKTALLQAQEAITNNISLRHFTRDFHPVFLPTEELHNCNYPEDL